MQPGKPAQSPYGSAFIELLRTILEQNIHKKILLNKKFHRLTLGSTS